MRAGPANKWVSLARNPATEDEAEGTPLSPANVWAAIEPLAPGGSDGRTLAHQIRTRFHPQITLDTKVTYKDARTNTTRVFYVRGVQTVNEAGDEMVLFAEEVQP